MGQLWGADPWVQLQWPSMSQAILRYNASSQWKPHQASRKVAAAAELLRRLAALASARRGF